MDQADAWAWQTSRRVTVTVFVEGDRTSAYLSMPEARSLLNELTDAINQVDGRG